MKVIKRDGRVCEFDSNKIEKAILKAMNETEKGINYEITHSIVNSIVGLVEQKDEVSVEHIQDLIELYLSDGGRFDVAKKYVLYRAEKTKLREQGWVMTELQRDIYDKKYRFNNESFPEFLDRVSGGNEYIRKAIRDKRFIPAGRILAGRGLKEHGKNVTLSNCYVMPKVDDTIESIFDTAKYLAKTYSHGGGCGVNISNLRPMGSKVQNSASTTTGATSFMDLYSMVTGLIGQKGRRGALMINLDVSHPDIEHFIDIKNSDNERVRYANISVNINDDFMWAVDNDLDYELRFEVEPTGEVISKMVKARDIFKKIATNSHNTAEPAMLFWDTIKDWHLMSADPTFEYAGVNPCAEEPLPAFGSCNLASINLAEFVNPDGTFNFSSFGRMVRNGVIYLNEVLDENMPNHPLQEQRDVSRDLRQIGLGLMGFADMLIKMGVTYGSAKSIEIIGDIGHFMINEALQQSAMLAKEYGTFPRYNKEAIFKSPFFYANTTDETRELVDRYGLRNSQLLTIAPTGSISTMFGVSGGLEPIFQISYTRKSETLHNEDKYYKVYTPIAKEYMENHGLKDESELPDFFITSQEIPYEDRIEVQTAWQEYIDASISSTVNLPEETTVEEVMDLYRYAWANGLKGITIYRENCQRVGILTTDKPKSKLDEIDELRAKIVDLANQELAEHPDVCPMCGGHMNHSGGCEECRDCGYSPCSI